MSVALAGENHALADSDPAVLARIWEPDVHLAIWRRPLACDLDGLCSLDWNVIDDIDEIVSNMALARDVPELIEVAGYGDVATALAREVVAMGERLAAILECTMLRLRLEVIETDACRKFHADNVTARLLMPLVGPGTQWLHAGSDGPIESLLPGEVGVFKGRLWAEEPFILHRSPPVAATGETRLLLAMNPCARDEMA